MFVQGIRKKLPWKVVLPFAINLVANVIFTPIQFGLRNLPLAAVDILVVWATIIWMSVVVWKHHKWVTVAQVPYFVWVSIATVLQQLHGCCSEPEITVQLTSDDSIKQRADELVVQTQIKVGQVYQRLSLLAASFGIWCQPMSQIVQIEEIKQEVAKVQPNPNLFPQLPFRLGFAAPEKHRTPRRHVAEVLVK